MVQILSAHCTILTTPLITTMIAIHSNKYISNTVNTFSEFKYNLRGSKTIRLRLVRYLRIIRVQLQYLKCSKCNYLQHEGMRRVHEIRRISLRS